MITVRIPNAPYLNVNLLGRFTINAYRAGQHRRDGDNPVIQRVAKSGCFDWQRGALLHVGRFALLVAVRGNGPARKRR